jgi:hypothetical protein
MRAGCQYCANSVWVRGTPNPLDSYGRWGGGYLFECTADGYYSVWRVYSGTEAYLQSWTYSPYINQGSTWNTLRVAANGSNMYFYINGALVWSGTDYSYSSGRAGITMFSDGTAGDRLWADYGLLNVGSYYDGDTISDEQRALNNAVMQGGSQCKSDIRTCETTPAGSPAPMPTEPATPIVTPITK